MSEEQIQDQFFFTFVDGKDLKFYSKTNKSPKQDKGYNENKPDKDKKIVRPGKDLDFEYFYQTVKEENPHSNIFFLTEYNPSYQEFYDYLASIGYVYLAKPTNSEEKFMIRYGSESELSFKYKEGGGVALVYTDFVNNGQEQSLSVPGSGEYYSFVEFNDNEKKIKEHPRNEKLNIKDK